MNRRRQGSCVVVAGWLLATAGLAAAAPLDLVDCVRLALVHNPDVQDAADSTLSAALGREASLAEFDFKLVPKISGGVQGGNNTNQSYQLDLGKKLSWTGTKIDLSGGTSVFSSVPQTTVPYLSQTRVTVSQPLWQGRSRLENRERIDDAERRVGSAKNAFDDARQALLLSVTRGFYDVVRAEELVAVAQGALDRVNELDRIARAKLSIGAVSKMDVFRTELHTARLKNALIDQQGRREAAIDRLRGLLGIESDVSLEIDASAAAATGTAPSGGHARIVTFDPGPGADPAAIVDHALDHRAEVTEAKAQVADAERKAVLAHYKIWPALDLLGSYARLGTGNNFSDSSHLDRTEWLLGVSSTTPLDRTEERVAASQAEITLRGRERALRATREKVIREVRESWRALGRARAQRELAVEIADHAEKQCELARFRYEKGITDNFDLVQAESERAEARSGQVLAVIEEVLAAADLRRAEGTIDEALGVDHDPPAMLD